MKVICSHRKICDEAHMCGGAKPHEYKPDECGKCTFHKDAVCKPVKDKTTKEG